MAGRGLDREAVEHGYFVHAHFLRVAQSGRGGEEGRETALICYQRAPALSPPVLSY